MLKTIAWIVVMLVLLEVGLEYRAGRRGYATILFGPAASAAKTAAGGAGSANAPVEGPTADFPFRSPVVPRERPAGKSRIWFASASYGEDIYVPVRQIFPNLVGEYLGAEVRNASNAGHTIAGNTYLLREIGNAWAPDVVVLYQLSLDIDRMARTLRGTAHRNVPGPATDENQAEVPVKPQPNGLVRFYESTTLYRTVKETVGGRINQQRMLADELGPEAETILRRELADFVAACRELGAEPVLCTFAASNDRTNYEQTAAAARTALFRGDSVLSLLGWVQTIDRLNGVIRDFAATEGLRLVDVAAALNGQPQYYRDFIHFNRRGHEAIAHYIATGLSATAAASDHHEL